MAPRLLLAAMVATLVVLAAVAVPLMMPGDSRSGELAGVMGPANGVHDEQFAKESANLTSVTTYDIDDRGHDSGEIDYDQVPPVAGPHDPIWLECGVYDRPVREENAVHALEHGTVWITYRAGLSDSDVERLVDLLPDDAILSPFDEQGAPVTVTVWNTQLRLSGVDDPRLELFIEKYRGGRTAPEPMASCHGGVERYESEGSAV